MQRPERSKANNRRLVKSARPEQPIDQMYFDGTWSVYREEG